MQVALAVQCVRGLGLDKRSITTTLRLLTGLLDASPSVVEILMSGWIGWMQIGGSSQLARTCSEACAT